jgi:hypothetical protein
MVALTMAGHSLTDADVATFEARQKVKLPASYRRFLLQSNGGRPDKEDILVVPGWPFKRTVVSFFFGIERSDTYELADNITRYEGRIPSDCIPIGDDVGGNILCLRIGGIHEGEIYFWDHEAESEQPESRSNIYKVADSIQALLDSLQPA